MPKNKIRELRKERGLSQSSLAKILGVAQNTLSYWENGKFDVDNKSLSLMADFFGVSVDYLLGRESAKKESPAASESGEADLDRELVSLLCQLDSPQEEQRVKDFVRGILAAREAPTSPDK